MALNVQAAIYTCQTLLFDGSLARENGDGLSPSIGGFAFTPVFAVVYWNAAGIEL